MILRCIWVLLLFIPYDKWCNVHRWQDSKYITASFRTLEQTIFLGIFQKPLWMLTLSQQVISLKSARLKNQQRKPWCKTLENMIFLYYFNNFNKNCGWRAGLLCFIGKLCKQVPGKLEDKLQAAVSVLYWYFFNLNEKTIVKKKYFFIFNS